MKETKKFGLKIAIVVLAALMISSTLVLFGNSQPSTEYGDIMQYDWPQGGQNEGNTGYNLGPGPSRPNVLWKVSTPGTGMVSVFNGLAFVIQGSQIGGVQGTSLHAFDALTGEKRWTSFGNVSINGVSGISKLDDTYLYGEVETAMIGMRIADGEIVWYKQIEYGSGHPGSGSYFDGHYSESMKMHFAIAWDAAKSEAQVLGYDLSDPSKAPPLKWTYIADTPSEILCSGGGKVFMGTTEATVYALNGMTGDLEWTAHTRGGLVQQNAMYYNGNLYTSAVSTQMTCFDGETGEIKWQYEKGPRTFSAYRGAAGFGMVFDSTVEVEPHGYVRAWDAETGELLWKQPGYYNIAYTTIAVADGKVYSSTCDRSAGSVTAGLEMPGYETSCLDAYTGTVLWKLKGINFAYPSIAYGNLYGLYGGYLYCIGGEPKDWNYGFVGNVETPRVAVGQSGPSTISIPVWKFQTGGDVSSSPAVVDGKVYVGSHDKHWYCIDAYTGQQIWNFTVGHYVRSSAAVVNGRVYTGADDGNFYALNANTGQKIWQTPTSGAYPNIMVPTEFEPRSSPIMVGNRLYVGALDGKVYCLNPENGNVEWTYTTGGPVVGSPAYSAGTLYITSIDSYLHAIDAASGTMKWKSMPLNLNVAANDRSSTWCIGTPTVAEDMVVVGGGVQYGTAVPGYDYIQAGHSEPSGAWGGTIRYMAFDATTGVSVWNITRAGNTQPGHVPCYFDGHIYAGEFFVVTSMDAENPNSGDYEVPDFGQGFGARLPGNRTWGQWLGYQISSSVAYADDPTGSKVYIGCDIGSVYCLDASTGRTLSVYTTKGNVASSPAVWNGKMFVGSTDGNLYCFDDAPSVDFTIYAESNKGAEMWNNETIAIGGRLTANPMEITWADDVYVSVESNMHPGLRGATVQLSLTKPDGTDVPLTATTDHEGYFTFEYTPTQLGQWGWVVYYAGNCMEGLTYNEVYGDYNSVNVVSPSDGVTPNPTTPAPAATTTVPSSQPTNNDVSGGFAVEYLYAAIAVVIVVIIVVAAYVFMKRKK